MTRIPAKLAGVVVILLVASQAVLAVLVAVGTLNKSVIFGPVDPPQATTIAVIAISIAFSVAVGLCAAVRVGFLTLRVREGLITTILWVAFVFYAGNVLGSLAAVSTPEGFASLGVSIVGSVALWRLAVIRRSPKRPPIKRPQP